MPNPEEIIAADINDASLRVGELFENVKAEDGVLKLDRPVHLMIQEPERSTNTAFKHNPADALVNALGVVAGCTPGGYLEKCLGRQFDPVLTLACLPSFYDGGGFMDAWRFMIEYSVVKRRGKPYLNCWVCYETADTYDFLIEDFTTVSLCMQAFAKQLDLPMGYLKINVIRPTCIEDNLQHIGWLPTGDTLGLTPLLFGHLICDDFMRELKELTHGEPVIGMKSSFLRRAVCPSIEILKAMNNNDLAHAKEQAKSLPKGLEYTVAVNEFLGSL